MARVLIPPAGFTLVPLRVLQERTPSIDFLIFLILFTRAKRSRYSISYSSSNKSKIIKINKKVIKKGYAKQVKRIKSFFSIYFLSNSKRKERLLFRSVGWSLAQRPLPPSGQIVTYTLRVQDKYKEGKKGYAKLVKLYVVILHHKMLHKHKKGEKGYAKQVKKCGLNKGASVVSEPTHVRRVHQPHLHLKLYCL